MIAAAVASAVLSSCAGGSWPELSEVERPRESMVYVAPPPEYAPPDVAPVPAPPLPGEAVLPLTDASLGAATARLEDAMDALAAADAAYGTALDALLGITSAGEAMNEAWFTAQNRLTGLGRAVRTMISVDSELAALGLGVGPGTDEDLIAAHFRAMEQAGTALECQYHGLLVENNRLAALTPPGLGPVGPRAIDRRDRILFIAVDLSDPDAGFAEDLTPPIRRALDVGPDLTFHVFSQGPDREQAQASLRRVTAALLDLGVPRFRLVVAVDHDRAMTSGETKVEIYLHPGATSIPSRQSTGRPTTKS